MSSYETQGFKLDNSGKRVVVDPVCRIAKRAGAWDSQNVISAGKVM